MGYWNGKRLKEWRETQGLSQKDTARHIGVTGPMVGDYERNVSAPTGKTMSRLTEWTGRPAAWFNDNPKPTGKARTTYGNPEWNLERLLLWRAMDNISTKKAGEIMGVSPATVGNYERGDTPVPDRVKERVLAASGRPESFFTATTVGPVGKAWEPSGVLHWYPARLTLWRARTGETIRQMAKRLSFDPRHLAAMETGAKPLTKRVCRHVLFQSGYPEDWFTSGEKVEYPQRRLDTPETGSWPWMNSPLRDEKREGWYPYRVWVWMDGIGFKPWKAERRLHMSWNRLKRVMDGDEELTPELKRRILKGTGLREGWFRTPPREDTPEDWGLLEGGIYDSPSLYAFLLDNPSEMRDAGVKDVEELKRIMAGVTPAYTPGGSLMFPEWQVEPGDKPVPPNCMRRPKGTGKKTGSGTAPKASDGKPVTEADASRWAEGAGSVGRGNGVPEDTVAGPSDDDGMDALALAKRILALRRDAAKLGLGIDVSAKKD